MKHQLVPFKEQLNPGIDLNDPVAEVTAVELQFPATFSQTAWRVINYMEGAMYLYSYKGEFVVTDESLYLTDHGNGSHEAPLGGPRWTGKSLEELEWWLESIAREYDFANDIPGWTVCPKAATKNYPAELLSHVLVTLTANERFIGIKTYDRKHGSKGRFLISRETIKVLLHSPKGTVCYETDYGNFVTICRQEDDLQFAFTWLSYGENDEVKGFKQDIVVPIWKLHMTMDSDRTIKHLYIPRPHQAVINANPAASTIRRITSDKHKRRAFIKAMRDCFHWTGDTVTLFRDGKDSFFFTTKSGFPKNGGLILHESTWDGHPYVYYSVHT